MRIPKSFKLNSHDIKVQFKSELLSEKGEPLLGNTDYNMNEIDLVAYFNGRKLPKSQIETTFCHELAHQFLYKMGQTKLSSNERFVEALGSMICQFLNSAKYK